MSGPLMGLMTSALSVCAPRQMQPRKVSAGPSTPYQSITFGFVRLIVWNCLLQIGTREIPDGGWGRMPV